MGERPERVDREELEALAGDLLPERISMSLMSVPAPGHVATTNVVVDNPVAEAEQNAEAA
jgi:hypothetical protein